jgi:hypothetical protein
MAEAVAELAPKLGRSSPRERSSGVAAKLTPPSF